MHDLFRIKDPLLEALDDERESDAGRVVPLVVRPRALRHRENVRPRRCYCGPASIAFIADVSAETAIETMNRVRGRRASAPITLSSTDEVKRALRLLGYSTAHQHSIPKPDKRFPNDPFPTLTRWAQRRTAFERTVVYLVVLRTHFVVVHGSGLWDTLYPKGIVLDALRKWKRSQVYSAWEIRTTQRALDERRARHRER